MQHLGLMCLVICVVAWLQEGNMPLEELLAIYRYEASVSATAASSMDESSGDLPDELPDMTLDKVWYLLL